MKLYNSAFKKETKKKKFIKNIVPQFADEVYLGLALGFGELNSKACCEAKLDQLLTSPISFTLNIWDHCFSEINSSKEQVLDPLDILKYCLPQS